MKCVFFGWHTLHPGSKSFFAKSILPHYLNVSTLGLGDFPWEAARVWGSTTAIPNASSPLYQRSQERDQDLTYDLDQD